MPAPITWAARFAVNDPNDGLIKGSAFGVFDGTIADPEMAGFLVKKISLRLPEVIADVGPHDNDAVASSLNQALLDTYQDLQAAGAVVVEQITVTSPAPAQADDARPAAPAGAALPFQAAPFVPPRVVIREPKPSTDPLNVTADGMISPFAQSKALPFEKGEAKPLPPAPASTSTPQQGATAFMPAFSELDLEVLPFDEEFPDLTVEQYASLCVERTLSPSEEDEVAKRYKVLTEEALRSLDARWRKRFADEGALYEQWQAAYAQYKSWLESQKK